MKGTGRDTAGNRARREKSTAIDADRKIDNHKPGPAAPAAAAAAAATPPPPDEPAGTGTGATASATGLCTGCDPLAASACSGATGETAKATERDGIVPAASGSLTAGYRLTSGSTAARATGVDEAAGAGANASPTGAAAETSGDDTTPPLVPSDATAVPCGAPTGSAATTTPRSAVPAPAFETGRAPPASGVAALG